MGSTCSMHLFLHVYSGLIEQRQFGQCQLVSRWRVSSLDGACRLSMARAASGACSRTCFRASLALLVGRKPKRETERPRLVMSFGLTGHCAFEPVACHSA